MGEYASILPRKLICFHCLEDDSNEPNAGHTEGAVNIPALPHTSDCETVRVTEKETSPNKNLTVLQVAVAREFTPREGKNTVVKSTNNAQQKCLYRAVTKEV